MQPRLVAWSRALRVWGRAEAGRVQFGPVGIQPPPVQVSPPLAGMEHPSPVRVLPPLTGMARPPVRALPPPARQWLLAARASPRRGRRWLETVGDGLDGIVDGGSAGLASLAGGGAMTVRSGSAWSGPISLTG